MLLPDEGSGSACTADANAITADVGPSPGQTYCGAMARKETEATRITSATRSHGDDISRRQRRYLASMAIRTVCFVLAIVFRGTALMWVFLAASLFLPYVAVVAANSAGSPDPGGPDPFGPDPSRKALDPPPAG